MPPGEVNPSDLFTIFGICTDCCTYVVIDLIDGANVVDDKDHRSDTEQAHGDAPIIAEESRPSCSSPPPVQKSHTQMTSSSRLADIVGSKRLRSICRGIFRGGKRHNHCSGFCPVISLGRSQVVRVPFLLCCRLPFSCRGRGTHCTFLWF